MTQIEFELLNYRSQVGKPFGGARLKGHPKGKRPFSKKHLMHLILKSSRAKGQRSFLHFKNRKMVDQLVRTLAKSSGVEIRDYVNVGNHLHILIKSAHRGLLNRFLRSLCGLLPRKLFGCEKGAPLGFEFWDGRPFTKIIAEGLRPFKIIRAYFDKNRRQAMNSAEGFDFWEATNTS